MFFIHNKILFLFQCSIAMQSAVTGVTSKHAS